MKVLLDTHALLWWLTDDPKLSQAAKALVQSEEVLVSVVSLWEIEIKRALGRIDGDIHAVAKEVAGTDGFAWLDVRPTHVLTLSELPLHHRDPFDRMLLAQARREGAVLLSRDAALQAYGVDIRW